MVVGIANPRQYVEPDWNCFGNALVQQLRASPTSAAKIGPRTLGRSVVQGLISTTKRKAVHLQAVGNEMATESKKCSGKTAVGVYSM
jgi:hypothetical protein